MNKLSTGIFRNRIEDHFDEVDLDVVCRKRKSGYALYWDHDREPIAKLRPTGRDDEVEVFSWEDGRWRKITEVEQALPLDEALEYITDDPDDLFLDGDNDQEKAGDSTSVFTDSMRELSGFFVVCSTIGGAVGGMFAGSGAGATWGAVAAVLCAGFPQLFRGRVRLVLLSAFGVGAPAAIPAAAGGALGGSLHAVLGSGVGWLLCSAVAGFLCSLFLLSHRFVAWWLGLAAGAMLGMQFLASFSPDTDTGRYLLVSVVAAVSASVCAAISKWCTGNFELADAMEVSA